MTIQRRPQQPLRSWVAPEGLGMGAIDDVSAELAGYVEVMIGRVEPPLEAGVLTLHELGDAYYARSREVEALIYKGERQGSIKRGSDWQKFRTGELQSYISIFRHASDLGSRRVTAAIEFRDDDYGD